MPFKSQAQRTQKTVAAKQDRLHHEHEPFFARCGGKPIVERDDFERRRPSLRRDKRSGKLERVCGAQRMHAQKSHGRFTNRVARLDLVPRAGQPTQPIERVDGRRSSSAPSRSRREIADAHSTSVPHHTSIAASASASFCSRTVASSFISSGTIAEASQNFIDRIAAPPEGPERADAFRARGGSDAIRALGNGATARAHDAGANQVVQPPRFVLRPDRPRPIRAAQPGGLDRRSTPASRL